jgi:hypothetical protein
MVPWLISYRFVFTQADTVNLSLKIEDQELFIGVNIWSVLILELSRLNQRAFQIFQAFDVHHTIVAAYQFPLRSFNFPSESRLSIS